METIEEVIDRLRGTCMETFEADEYTDDELKYLDENIFECARCGWWCDIDESNDIHGENYCDDCYGDEIYEQELEELELEY